MYRTPSGIVLLSVACLCAAGGCGSSEETEQAPPEVASPVQEQQPPPQAGFETTTDTVSTQRGHALVQQNATSSEPQIRYMVQIGAFKNPQLASRLQVTARERYHLPVLNDYNTRYALYQIRIGFFESREDAASFRERMVQEHPGEYKDAWVVQLKR